MKKSILILMFTALLFCGVVQIPLTTAQNPGPAITDELSVIQERKLPLRTDGNIPSLSQIPDDLDYGTLLKKKVEAAQAKSDLIKAAREAGAPGGTAQNYYASQVELADADGNVAVPEREKLRYDNRTFWDWRNQAETELNPERHLEIVRAFGAFGRRGYGKEATGAVLKLLADYPEFQVSIGYGSKNDLPQLVTEIFARNIPVEDSIPILLEQHKMAKENRKEMFFNLLAATILNCRQDIIDENTLIFQPVIAILLDKFQDNPARFGDGTFGRELSWPWALMRLMKQNPEIAVALEKEAFGKKEIALRLFAFSILAYRYNEAQYDQEAFQKYFPRLTELLLSDDETDQEFAGKTVRYYAFGNNILVYQSHDNDKILRGAVRTISINTWIEPDQTLFTDTDMLRQVLQAMMFLDESGVQTAKFLKGAFIKAPENVREILSNSRLFAVGPSIPRTVNARGSVRQRQSLLLLNLYIKEASFTSRGDNLRKELADTPELLALLDTVAMQTALAVSGAPGE